MLLFLNPCTRQPKCQGHANLKQADHEATRHTLLTPSSTSLETSHVTAAHVVEAAAHVTTTHAAAIIILLALLCRICQFGVPEISSSEKGHLRKPS